MDQILAAFIIVYCLYTPHLPDVTKLDPGRGDVCGGDSERNPGHETEQELDLF